jgi:hypothetical protein
MCRALPIVADRVIRKAGCPVLIVPHSEAVTVKQS